VIASVVISNSCLDEVVHTSILKTGRFPPTHDLSPGDNAQDEPHLATIA
jgi:hypothetical protein